MREDPNAIDKLYEKLAEACVQTQLRGKQVPPAGLEPATT